METSGGPPPSTTPSSALPLILACFAADSLSLACHWEYDPSVIRQRLGRVDRLMANTLTRYHPTKAAGDFTHFGDVAVVQLESILERGAWDQHAYAKHWQQRWQTLDGWKDQATRHTLDNMAAGKPVGMAGSNEDDDIGHLARLFTLLSLHLDEDAMATSAREMVAVTQTDQRCSSSAEFFARTLTRVQATRARPTTVMQQVAAEMDDDWLTVKVRAGLSSARQDDLTAMRRFGTACYIDSSLPGVVHFVARYEDADDPLEALVEDNAVGGNNAARNILIAALLYAHRGTELPSLQRLVDGLRQKATIERLVTDIERTVAHSR